MQGIAGSSPFLFEDKGWRWVEINIPFPIKVPEISRSLIQLTPESTPIDSDPLLEERVTFTIFNMMVIEGSSPFSLKRRAGDELK